MPCIYFTKRDFGRLGSGFFKYKYSAICFQTPINEFQKYQLVTPLGEKF